MNPKKESHETVELLDTLSETPTGKPVDYKEYWQELYSKIMETTPEFNRHLIITPYFGHYGLSGYVITVEGSPVRATAILDIAVHRLTCIGTFKTVRINADEYPRNARTNRKLSLYQTTLSLLKSLNLELHPGGEDDPKVVYVKSDEALREKRGGDG